MVLLPAHFRYCSADRPGYGSVSAPEEKVRKTVIPTNILALLSIDIEYTQYHFGLGLAEVDDVIHNTLGALPGVIACSAAIKLRKK